jgi:electron transfer flavoprotein alpha subunit
MANDVWVVAVADAPFGGALRVARGLGGAVTVVAVGPRELADAAAAAGADAVLWAATSDDRPAEAWIAAVADEAAAAGPLAVLAPAAPAARALLAAAAVRLGATLVSGVLDIRVESDGLAVDRAALDGQVVETLAVPGVLGAVVVADGEVVAGEGPTAAVAPLPGTASDATRVTARLAAAGGAGIHDAARVVSVGRGLKAKDDLALVGTLVDALGAELGCSMPVADDLGWVPKDHYVGRSGQQISPRLYLALGIAGMPQHMEGVRGAKVVAAVNTDPHAPIFRTAQYGVVGDLYEVVPALVEALRA